MKDRGFTIVELIVVMSIILVLAGLILATSGYVHNKGTRSRTEAEIAAMSAALESYKADNGSYPIDSSTNTLDARSDFDPTQASYQLTSLRLYESLSGDTNADRIPETTSYLSFKDSQLSPTSGNVRFIKDPFGNSYGYSTAHQTNPSKGYNPTYDLWSTAGATSGTNQTGWIKNW